MKTRGKRPTRDQKIKISKLGLNVEDYLILRETDDKYILKNKHTDKVVVRLKKVTL